MSSFSLVRKYKSKQKQCGFIDIVLGVRTGVQLCLTTVTSHLRWRSWGSQSFLFLQAQLNSQQVRFKLTYN